jgi:hypothetical protein
MPDDLQLYENVLRIQREDVAGDGGDDTKVVQVRTTGSSITRDIAAQQERVGPFRTREFLDNVHQAWEIEIRGNLRTGGFLRWLVDHIGTTAAGERGLDVIEIRPDTGDVPTWAIQVDGIDGTTTFLGAALQRLSIEYRGRRKVSWTATFAALKKDTTADPWTTDVEEAGEIMTTSRSTAACATDLESDPEIHRVTAYEAAIELTMPGLAPAQFSADGEAQGFTRQGTWELTGRLLMPEADGITDLAFDEQYSGEVNIAATGDQGEAFEVECGIIGVIDRRQAQARDWKQASFDFVNRRGPTEPIFRLLTNHPEL